MTWQLVAGAEAATAIACLSIGLLIARGLLRTGQWRTNRMGAATALIFLAAAVHQGSLAAHLLLPSFGLDVAKGAALRDGAGWDMLLWASLTAVAGILYLSLRGSYAGALRGAQMYEDIRERERQALEINDTVVQGLTVAKYAMAMGADEQSRAAIDETLRRARGIITELLGEPGAGAEPEPGALRRSRPATMAHSETEPVA